MYFFWESPTKPRLAFILKPVSLFRQQCGFHKYRVRREMYISIDLLKIEWKKKTTIDYYKPQVVVLFSLWNNSYMYHARGLLNRFWLTFSSSSFIQRGVDLDTCEWQCWKCVRVCQQRKNSYTAVSIGSNINLPKQRVFMNSILWYNKRNKTWIIHHTLKCSKRTLKKVFIDLKWSAWNSFQRQCHIHHCRPVFYDQHVMLIDNSYHGL